MAAINCTAAALAAFVTFGATVATPATGGASATLAFVGKSATVATGASCIVSTVRVYNAAVDPARNGRWDEDPNYRRGMQVIDGVALLGVGASALQTARIVGLLRQSNVTLREASKGAVTRQARRRIARAAQERALGKTLSNAQYKRLVQEGALVKRFTKRQLQEGVLRQAADAIAAGLSFASSAADGEIRHAALAILEMTWPEDPEDTADPSPVLRP
ncbi:MAG: hypothetical protein AAF318_09200 [Pseudomonadota bacterium]